MIVITLRDIVGLSLLALFILSFVIWVIYMYVEAWWRKRKHDR